MNNKNLDRLIQQELAIESEEVKEAAASGYMARALVQGSLPNSRPGGLVFERTNGAFSLAMMGRPHAVCHGAAVAAGLAYHRSGANKQRCERPS